MKRAVKMALVLFLLDEVSVLAWGFIGQRKPVPLPLSPPKPLTQAQIRRFSPGTTGAVVSNPNTFTLYTIDPYKITFLGGKTHFSPPQISGYKVTGERVKPS